MNKINVRFLKAKLLLAKFLAKEDGISAIEYVLIAAGIALAIITAVNSFGTKLTNMFTSLTTAI